MVMLAVLTDTPQPGEHYTTSYGLSASIRRLDWGADSALVCAMESADPRATVRALKDQGATHLWLCESVGTLSTLLEVGDWLVPEDFIDGTRGQHYTYYSERAGGYVQQVPPFDPASRAALIEALKTPPPDLSGVGFLSPEAESHPAEGEKPAEAGSNKCGTGAGFSLEVHTLQKNLPLKAPPDPLPVNGEGEATGGRVFKRGVYVCVSNTRLETPAEANFWTRAGGHVVGRFLSPCLMLARELDMPVAVLNMVARAGGEPGSSLAFENYERLLRDAVSILKEN